MASAVYNPGNRFEDERYLFIDGSYLREAIKTLSEKYFVGQQYELDYSKLSSSFRKTFYYDCLPGRRSQESEEEYNERISQEKKLFNSLRKIKGFHVHEGCMREGKNRRQKMVDVMIAVDMLNHTIRGNMTQATFIGGDLDFKPLVDALVQNGMFITLLYEKSSASEDLINAADFSEPITIDVLHRWASNRFQKSFIMPRAIGSSSEEIKEYEFLKKGLTSSGDLIELHHKNGVFCISYPDNLNDGCKNFISHNNLEFLEKYVQDVRRNYVWDA